MISAAAIWPMVGLAAEIEGDRTAAAQQPAPSQRAIDLVAGVVGELPRTGPYLGTWYLHARADLARALHQDSCQAWAEVCDGWRTVRHDTNLAQASYRLADVLTRSGDREAAAAPLSRAWLIADRLGAVPLRDRVVALSRRARIRIDPGPGRAMNDGRPGGRLASLTDRELEVLRHVAVGLSNSEIAEALFMSPKTASVHVSHILAKLQVTSRTKATAVALEEGLDVDIATN